MYDIFTCKVCEGLQRNLLILIEEHLDLPHTDPQVRLIKLIGNIPT